VVAELTKKVRRKRQRSRVLAGKKRFKASSGKYAQLTVLDANTETFGSDLLSVFRKNVAEARKENMRLFGSPDRVPSNK
jgi:hypothetical protein